MKRVSKVILYTAAAAVAAGLILASAGIALGGSMSDTAAAGFNLRTHNGSRSDGYGYDDGYFDEFDEFDEFDDFDDFDDFFEFYRDYMKGSDDNAASL